MKDNRPELDEDYKEAESRIIIIVPDDEEGGWVATRGDHISLTQSPYGRGFTAQMALENLFKSEIEREKNADTTEE